MPDDLTTTPEAVCSRVDAAAMHQLTLLESTITALRPRLNDEALDVEAVVALTHQIGALSHMMLQWVAVLMGTPANEGEEEG